MNLNLPQQYNIHVMVINAGSSIPSTLLADTEIKGHKLRIHHRPVGHVLNVQRNARALRIDVVVFYGDLTQPDCLDYLRDLLQSDLQLPIIAVTQQGSREIAHEVIAAGCQDYYEQDKSPHLALRIPFAICKAYATTRIEQQSQKCIEIASKVQKTKDDFMAVMNHEIRTPMNSIIGFTDLLLDSPQDDSQRDYLDIIKGNAYTLLGTINNVLSYSRLDSATVQLEKTEMDIGMLLQEIEDVFTKDIQDKGLNLTVDIAPELPLKITSGYNELRQAIFNLTSNAIKFTPSGSIHIEVKGYCDLKHQNASRWTYVVTVSDTGIGIEHHEQHNIFDIFKQIDSSSTRKFGGTGLGLAICKKIAELLQGEIWLESEKGKGSAFHFSFQAGVAHEQEQDSSLAHSAAKSNNPFAKTYPLNILLAQPASKERQQLEDKLSLLGYTYKVVETSSDVLHAIEKNSFDIALMDSSVASLDEVNPAPFERQGLNALYEQELFICALICLQQPYQESQNTSFDALLSKPITSDQLQSVLMKAACRANTQCEHRILNIEYSSACNAKR